jgi:hypothetical protein
MDMAAGYSQVGAAQAGVLIPFQRAYKIAPL